MILLFKDCTNQVIVTLAEKKMLNTDIYLFEFTNILSNEKFYCVSQDSSEHQYRYQRFCITHISSGSTDPYQSQVNIPLEGFYDYVAYENPDSVLNPDGLNVVEVGRMKLIGFSQSIPTFEPANNTRKVFDPKNYS